MAGKIEASKAIKHFDGEGDVASWLAKIELVASLTDVKDVAKLVPLYLEGGALALYLELDDSKRNDFRCLSQELLRAYSDSQIVSFSKLRALQWAGEPVEVFANNIRKLARGSGLTGEGLEQVVKLSLITGFPDSISVELQQATGVDNMSVSDVLSRARVLANNTKIGSMAAPAVGGQGGQKGDAKREPLKCYDCGGPHIARYCPERKKDSGCWKCGGPHIARFCPEKKKNAEEDKKKNADVACYEHNSRSVLKVPVISVVVGGRQARALVDTGCTTTMVREGLVADVKGEAVVSAFDGREVKCKGTARVKVQVAEKQMERDVTVVSQMVNGVDIVLGMDVIEALGGVRVWKDKVQFGNVCAVAYSGKAPDIVDKDFEAWFHGGSWEVRYHWNEKGEPKVRNTVGEYSKNLTVAQQKEYEAEVERWIQDGILVPWKGEVSGVIPLMAVEQPTKNKIRPVLDFRELNENVSCHTGDEMTDVCSERLREWRQTEGEGEIVDLRAAYLQIKVSEDLWKHQLVRYRGEVYALTRLGFGLNSAPRIMTSILKYVLSKREDIESATSSFIDDIMVNVSQVDSSVVVDHLSGHGLEAKEPALLEGGAVLGLKLAKDKTGRLVFTRANTIPDVGDVMTRKELFSVCGKLVGHYPRAGWLRVACSYMKRHASGQAWNDYVGDAVRDRMREVVEEVEKSDPVTGIWKAPKSDSGVVWCDASDLAMGVILEIGGTEVEDASWVRKKNDYNHINVAELEAVLKGINLCAKWGLQKVEVVTDSATVYGWINLTLTEEKKVKTKGAAEMLVKRRLGILKSLIQELSLQVTVRLVKSAVNKADELTRIRKRWMIPDQEMGCVGLDRKRLKELHAEHHMGVERTWFLAKKLDESVEKEEVKKVLRECQQCQSIDPAPTTHVPGNLEVEKKWSRLAIDVTHYRGLPFLTMVDCGPGRHIIWREMKGESATEICREINSLFYERGPVDEVLMDNAAAFKSDEMNQLLEKWGVVPYFRAAHRASGNGIVERSHRTIKAMAERSGSNPIESVFFYNVAPRKGQKSESVPQRSLFTYEWRLPGQPVEPSRMRSPEEETKIQIGDEVWVKPGNARCTSQWKKGEVTGINSSNNIEVDGMPRHVLDIRRVVEESDDASSEEEEAGAPEPRYPQRERSAPGWMRDFVAH